MTRSASLLGFACGLLLLSVVPARAGGGVGQPTGIPAPHVCENAADDDGDGLIDYPQDPGCAATYDDDEYNDPGGGGGGGGGGGDGGEGGGGGTTGSNCDGGAGIYLYRHVGWGGRCSKFTASAADLGAWYVGNDTVSSVRVVGNYVAAVFEHGNYGGRYVVVRERDVYSLSDTELGENVASSVEVALLPAELKCEDTNSCAGAGAGEESYDAQTTSYSGSGGFQAYPYSLSSCEEPWWERETDPVGMVFYGYGTAVRALNHVQHHTGWTVRPTPSQSFASFGSCGKTYGERASGTRTRFHVRVRKTAMLYGTYGTTSLATPHFEDFRWPKAGLGCWHAVREGGGSVYGGFMAGRDELFTRIAAGEEHSSHLWQYWGNTREFEQCDGGWAGGDGWVAWLWIPPWGH